MDFSKRRGRQRKNDKRPLIDLIADAAGKKSATQQEREVRDMVANPARSAKGVRLETDFTAVIIKSRETMLRYLVN